MTCVTGLPTSCNGRDSVRPLIPDIAVPSQNASMSCLVRPTASKASFVDSIIRSSTPLFQCSPNGVHPIEMMAT